MKNAIILHGTGCSPEHFWLPWLRKKLESRGFKVWAPQLPKPNKPELSECLPLVIKEGIFNEETILIGHSSGSVLILSILENLNTKIKQAILVAGYSEEIDGTVYPFVKESYDWNKIKNNVEEIIFINSDNDPFGCTDKVGKKMLEKTGGTLIVPHGQGHMGSTSFKQPYKEFPLLLKLI